MLDDKVEDRVADDDMLAHRHDALDAVRDIVLVMRDDGTLFDVNWAAVDAYGYERDELLGLNVRDLRAPQAHVDLKAQMRSASEGGVTFETLHRRRDGSVFPVEVSSSRFEVDGRPGLISVVRNSTARKEHEALRARLVEQLSETNLRLDGALTLLSSTVGATDLDTLLVNTVTAVSQVMATDAALFLVYEGGDMRVRAQSGANAWAPVGSVVKQGEGFCGRVAEAVVPLYVADISATSAMLSGHQAAGLCSMFGVPVYVDGELFGVLECAWTEERLVDEAESAMVRLGAERIALAIGQARLYERSVTSARYSEMLNEINALLNGSFEIEPILDEVLGLATSALRADMGVYARSTPDGWTVEHAIGVGTLEGALGLTHAPNSSTLADPADIGATRGAPQEDWMAQRFGLAESVIAPVQVRHGSGGAILFGRRVARDGFDDLAVDFVRGLAQSFALALTNAAHYETEHHIAETLQEALLLMPASVHGIDFAHLYRSATLSTRVGGDFFDVFEMAGKRVGILVGDVSGKGLEAAVLTSIIKDTIRAYAHENPSPADVIAKANIALGAAAKLPDFASVFFAVIETDTGKMSYCNAGHPPAAVVAHGAPVRLLEGTSAVIGAFPDLVYTDNTISLGADECVLLYTDGVTEARDSEGAFFGEEGLLSALASLQSTDVSALPETVFDAVLGFTDGRLTDDTALLAFRLVTREGDRP